MQRSLASVADVTATARRVRAYDSPRLSSAAFGVFPLFQQIVVAALFAGGDAFGFGDGRWHPGANAR